MSATPLETRLLLELFRVFRHLQASIHELNYLFWECTLRCNLSCRHCGSDCSRSAAANDMPLGDFLRVLDEVAGRFDPHKVVVVTGGEPLLRPDLVACGEGFRDRGFPWGVVTNGWSLTPERLASLREAGLRSITVSVDGLEEAHDWLRGRRGSHARAMEAARTCARAAGLVSDVVTCVNQRTIGELGRIKTMLVEAGVKAWRVITIFPRGRAARHPELRLTASQFRELMDFIVSCRAEGALRTSYDCEGFLGPYERRVRDGFAYCRAGITIASVLADGGISACPTVRGDFVQGSIYRDSFLDVWNTRYAIMRNRQWTRTGVCTGCEVYRWCEGNGLHLRTEHSDGPMVCHWRLLHEQGTQEGPGDPSVR